MSATVKVPRQLVAELCRMIMQAPSLGISVAAAVGVHNQLQTCLQPEPLGMELTMEGDKEAAPAEE